MDGFTSNSEVESNESQRQQRIGFMKTHLWLAVLTIGTGLGVAPLHAQDAAPGAPPSGDQRPPGPGRPGGPRRGGPLIEALDLNKDGVIDAEELAKASESLKALDKNSDGKITADELRRPRPAGASGDAPPAPPAGGPGPGPGPDGAEHRPPPGPDGQPGAGPRPLGPVFAALDTNKDGTLDASEIANATASLRTLDKDNDGKLTVEELRPARPAGAGGGEGQRPRRPRAEQ